MRSSSRARGIFFAAGFAAGAFTAANVSVWAAGAADSIYEKLEVLAQVFGHIENHYVDAIAPTELVYGAARGALGVLDEHSAFFAPSEYKELLDATEGEYAGVGIELEGNNEDLPEVVTVLEGSAAFHAGVQVGDRLVAVDDTSIAGLNLETILQRLRGPAGSKVVLTVRRRGRDDTWRFTLVRGWVRIAPLEHRRLRDGVLYVRIKTFSRRVASDLSALLARESVERGLVLDLRGNPGGLFDEAVAVVDLFLRDGPIVTAIGRNGRVVERYEARAHGSEPDGPLAVLIDRGSASAAEVVAGSLADRRRARLFGTRSYGKGSVQSVLDLADGSGLKLTVARYSTPSGRPIDQHGIEPDEVVEGGGGAPLEDPVVRAACAWVLQAR